MQVEGQHIGSNTLVATGARVRNAYAIYLLLGHSPEKFGLTPHSTIESHGLMVKGYGKR